MPPDLVIGGIVGVLVVLGTPYCVSYNLKGKNMVAFIVVFLGCCLFVCLFLFCFVVVVYGWENCGNNDQYMGLFFPFYSSITSCYLDSICNLVHLI